MSVRLFACAALLTAAVPTSHCALGTETKEVPVYGSRTVGLVAIDVGNMTESGRDPYGSCAGFNERCAEGESSCLGVRQPDGRSFESSVCAASCTVDADCPAPPGARRAVCQSGRCTVACGATTPCPSGMTCSSATCLWPR